MALSNSAIALHRLLEEKTPETEALTARYHRTALWRYRKGDRKPDVETAAEIERISGGRVPANGWEDIKGEPVPSERAS